tara:strand:+ start:85 stop:660 length:576 start_codon:yes stop_codon:yes gene_type:complete
MPKKEKKSDKKLNLKKIVIAPKKTERKKKPKKINLREIVIAPKKAPKKPAPIKKKSEKEKETPQEPQQQFEEGPAQFRQIALEELTTEDVSTRDLGQGARWIRLGQKEEEEEKEPAIYDLAKATSEKGYTSIDDSYKLVGTGGDYDAIQRAGQTTPGFQDPTQPNPVMNQAQSYETSGEKELKERRKRELW